MADRVLVVAAHPDDWEVGAVGQLVRASHRFVLVASCGERGGPGDVRAKEAEAARTLLGAYGQVLRHPDTSIFPAQLAPDIEAMIREVQPTLLVTHSPNDAHQDHVAVCQASLIAVREWYGTVLGFWTPSAAERFRPNWYIGLSPEAMAHKLAVVNCHKSQAGRPYLAPAYLESAGRYWAQVTRSSAPFVEPYELLRHREP